MSGPMPLRRPLSRVDYRSVSERLSDRCDALEAHVVQLGKNCDWLKAESDVVRLRIEERRSDILAEVGAAIGAHVHMTRWQRLRWVLTGR